MKYLLGIDAPANPDGGASGTVVQTATALRELGHEVDCIWSADLPHRISHWNLHYLLELPWAFRKAVGARCRQKEYDVVLINQPYSWLAARDHRRYGRPGVFITETQGWEPRVSQALAPWRRKYGIPEWRFPRGCVGRPIRFVLNSLYARWAALHSDGILTHCSNDRAYICREYGLPETRVAVVPMGIPPSFLATPAPPMTDGRLKRVLYVGQFSFFKGLHVLGELFEDLASHIPGFELSWLCPEDRRHDAMALLGPAGRKSVRFLDTVPQGDLMGIYDSHGIFVFSTFGEGFGKVFLEAMSRGMIVVASDAAGMRDVIETGRNGYKVPVGDVDAFLQTIEGVARNVRSASDVSLHAVHTAASYTWERVAAEICLFAKQLHAVCP